LNGSLVAARSASTCSIDIGKIGGASTLGSRTPSHGLRPPRRPSSSAVLNTPETCCITTRTVFGASGSPLANDWMSPLRIDAIGRSPK
jgi:hypothetical protein